MVFIIKKILGALLMPMTLLFFLIFTGLGLLWSSKNNRKRTGTVIITVAVSLLFLMSFPPLSSSLLKSLERTYPSITQIESPVKYIWVLGGYASDDTSVPIQSRLYQESLYRVLEGVRLYKDVPEAKLVFSGYGAGDTKSVAEIGAEVAVSLGVPEETTVILSDPRDTWDEAVAAKKLIGDSPFILVTTAYHMKRSVFIFNQNGLDPVPAPCGHLIKKRSGANFKYFLPSAQSVLLLRRYIHEQLGLLWLKILLLLDLTDYA